MRARLVLLAALLGACTSNPYFIGAIGAAGSGGSGGTADTDPSLSFAVDLDQSGTSHLSPALTLAGGAISPNLVLRGEEASASQWPSAQGALLVNAAAQPVLQLPAPFTDQTRSVGLPSAAASYAAQAGELGALGAGDFALELVLRAEPGASIVDKRAGGIGWSLGLTADATLGLTLQDEQTQQLIVTEPLVADAWYHCLFWASRSVGGRAYCNGREGALTDLSALGAWTSFAKLAVGGGATPEAGRSQLAYLGLFVAAAGALGDGSAWATLSRQRFAALTGVSPRVARGNPLPAPGLRDSAAYLDLQRDSRSARELFIVGPDWPRIACRSDDAGTHDCGYLSETERTRWLEPSASAWTKSALSVSSNSAPFADGTQRMEGVLPSSELSAHTLAWTGSYSGARQALSFFARAETGRLISVSVSQLGSAVFDVRAGSVVSAPSVGSATIEDWGGGLFRCAYVFPPDPGPATYTIELLADAKGTPFAGDGKSVWVDLAQLQLDVGQAYAGSPLAAQNQAADTLTFVGDDGNLPSSPSVTQRLRVMLPAGPRLTDQAILNLNIDAEFDNQAQLYITGDTNQLKFWGLRDGDAHWAFNHPVSLVDGLRHAIEATWGTDYASLSVDGVSLQQDALHPNTPPLAFNRIDVGFFNSSGSLEGLLAGLQIGVPKAP